MKVFSMVLLVSVLSVVLLTGNALAIPTFTGDPVADFDNPGEDGYGEPDAQPGNGYTIWATDDLRTQWAVRWIEFDEETWYQWDGEIVFSNTDGLGEPVKIGWETNDGTVTLTQVGGTDKITFGTAQTGEHYDGFDFTLTGDPGDTLTFKLESSWFNTTNDGVYIGQSYASVLDNCDDATGFRSTDGSERHFIISAPVPVPAAVWLLGSGIIGLIGIGRRCRS
ncbi:MAG: VPLPA-CTERM sorting domain-containing protein [Thermodesulfobacteriota bacterium]|nr:VPLPA-CTERM sorting domain-containing protein [Thermodesulfobacteriota bacterium]